MTSQSATVLVTDYAWPSLTIEEEILGAVGARVVAATTGAEDELIRLAPEADIILTCWQRVTAAVLDAAPRCRAVGRYGIGLDNIAVDHATALGILVTNVPDFCLEEVSDHALALLLACARRIVYFARATQSGVWNLAAGQPIPRLRGQTLGLIGYGGIARALAPKAHALGLRVLAYTPRLTPGPLDATTTGTNNLDELLAASDFVSIHVPLTGETRGMIDARALRQMKPTAFLINTSRGAVIDEAALAQALADEQIAGAALDVLAHEPPDPDHPLLRSPNAILTPHAAFYSEAAIADLQRQAAEQAAAVLRGELPPNIVNPAVLQQPNYRAGAR
ncbi:MAG: C-terminal binding protein [Thermomicrobiales bacterium]